MGSVMGASFRVGFGVVLFVAGYSFCRYVSSDEQYTVLRKNGEPYLYDMLHDQALKIDTHQFQVGSLHYRLHAILNDHNLPDVLQRLMEDHRDQ